MTLPTITRKAFRRSLRAVQTSYLPQFNRYNSSNAPITRIGFIGLGNMGLPMCLNLLKNNPETRIFAHDINPQPLDHARSSGAIPVPSPANLIQDEKCQVIFTMLPGCKIVDSTISTLLPPKTSGTIFVDCSTISPITSTSLHEKVSRSGNSMIDAPVSGGVVGAQNASLTFMVGGGKSVLSRVRYLLESMGSSIIHCGGPSTGSATKICNNLALATQMIGICEAMNLGEALGVDPYVLAKTMNSSTAKCWSCEVNNPHPHVAEVLGGAAKNGYEGGFGTSLMLKDLGLAVGAGEEKNVSLPLGGMSKELYGMVEKHGGGAKDFGVMLRFLKGERK